MVKVVEEVKALAEGRVEPEPCSVASSVLLCIVLISLSGFFIGTQTNFSSGPAWQFERETDLPFLLLLECDRELQFYLGFAIE